MQDYWEKLRLFDRNVRWFLMGTAVHGFVYFGIYTLLLNLYLIRLGYDAEFIGVVNGTGPLILMITSIPAGIISQRIGSRLAIWGAYVASVLAFGLLPISEWLPLAMQGGWIVGTYALAWFAGAFALVNFSPYIMMWTGEEERPYAFALRGASFPLAGFVGSLLGGQLPALFARLDNLTLADPLPYRNALLVGAAIELLAVWAMWQTTEMAKTAVFQSSSPIAAKTSPPYRWIILFGAVSLLFVAAEWTMRIYFNVYLDTVFTIPTSLIGALSAGALFMGLTAFVSPHVVARLGRKRMVLFGLLALSASFLPLILIKHWLAVGIGYMLVIGVISLVNPVYVEFSQMIVEPAWRTTISSVISMSIGAGVALTSFGGGRIIEQFGFVLMFAVGASAALLGAIIVWSLFPADEHMVHPRETAATD